RPAYKRKARAHEDLHPHRRTRALGPRDDDHRGARGGLLLKWSKGSARGDQSAPRGKGARASTDRLAAPRQPESKRCQRERAQSLRRLRRTTGVTATTAQLASVGATISERRVVVVPYGGIPVAGRSVVAITRWGITI